MSVLCNTVLLMLSSHCSLGKTYLKVVYNEKRGGGREIAVFTVLLQYLYFVPVQYRQIITRFSCQLAMRTELFGVLTRFELEGGWRMEMYVD